MAEIFSVNLPTVEVSSRLLSGSALVRSGEDGFVWGLYGALDRYNYGDLLFPIVTRKLIRQLLPGQEFRTFGLVESDLSRFGADPTEASSALSGSTPCAVLLMCGGEILSQRWCGMLNLLVESRQARAMMSVMSVCACMLSPFAVVMLT